VEQLQETWMRTQMLKAGIGFMLNTSLICEVCCLLPAFRTEVVFLL
jgi:hypothetical protein